MRAHRRVAAPIVKQSQVVARCRYLSLYVCTSDGRLALAYRILGRLLYKYVRVSDDNDVIVLKTEPDVVSIADSDGK